MRLSKACFFASILAFIFAWPLVIAGCGDEIKTTETQPETNPAIPVISEAAKNLDPCTLLTKDDVQNAIGQSIKEPERKGTSCTYDSVDVSQFQSLLVIAQAGTSDDFEYQSKVLGGENVQPLTGVGDRAVFLSDSQIMVLKKDILINIAGFGIKGDALKTLAQEAADRVT